MKRPSSKTRLALVALAASAALVAVGAASAAPAATRQATPKCWLQVVNDWLAHGQVEGTYAIPCYTQAIQHLDAYPDIKQYSSAIDDIHRALLYAIQHPGASGPGGGSSGGSSGGPSGGSSGGSGGGTTGGSSGGGSGKGFISRVAGDIGPGNAQSIPLPLLVLGGLAVLLLLTAAGTWFARRLQARRITPTPAPARAGGTVRREP
ncbi:MAG TPA: hypothetical protein VKR23_03475 [Gaiellaceae bacterium]|nr:hypothetical protein [Gaiellaceae bacterium]